MQRAFVRYSTENQNRALTVIAINVYELPFHIISNMLLSEYKNDVPD